MRPARASNSASATNRHIYEPTTDARELVRLDTLNNRIIAERVSAELPYYGRIRDLLMSDWIKNLFLVRHAESEYNVANRIGGDSGLTEKGHKQAWALSRHFIGHPAALHLHQHIKAHPGNGRTAPGGRARA